MTADTDPELGPALLRAAQHAPMATHPFVRGVMQGTVPPATVRNYAVSVAELAGTFPRKLAAVLSICPNLEVRRTLLANLLEEEGVTGIGAGHGLTVVEERRHVTMAQRFARAAGAAEEELPRGRPKPARWFADAIAAGQWLGAFAYFAVGFEANVPATFRLLTPALVQHYGFAIEDLVFLTEHFTADERHGIESAALIGRLAVSAEDRTSALEGARHGGLAWWLFHLHALRERTS
jgi:pyrroloquinoline quinone (PQQ) biosynthesis protein C